MANDYEKRLVRVWDHIHDNPAGDLSLDALADVAALSRFHFHRVFHAMTGQTVASAVRRLRLYRASVALVTTAAPLVQVARAVGYDNLTSFSRAFTDAYGLTPTAFRTRGGCAHPIPPFAHRSRRCIRLKSAKTPPAVWPLCRTPGPTMKSAVPMTS